MEISKTGHNVATAIFQKGCQIQYRRILINTACRAIIMVCHCMFQETPISNIQLFGSMAFISAIFKDGGRQYKCPHISKTMSPRAILLTLLHSLVDSYIKYVFVTFNNITIRAIFKDGVCQSPFCPYLRNTVFGSIFLHILSAPCR